MAKFWGLILEGGRRYMQKVDTGFCISMAVLENKADSKDSSEKGIKLFVERDKLEFLLCTLTPKSCQLPLRIKFGQGETVALYFTGGSSSSRLHLSGYSFSDNSRLSPFHGQQQSILVKKPSTDNANKKRVSIKESTFASSNLLDESSDDSDEDVVFSLSNGKDQPLIASSDDDDDIQVIKTAKQNIEKKLEAAKESSSDDDEDEDEEDDSDDDDDDDDDDDEDTDVAMQESPKKSSINVKKDKQKQSEEQSTPKRKSESATIGMKTPENQNIKQLKQVSSAGHTPMKFFSKSGVLCQDLKVGTGPPAKQTKMVTVYYSGRLKSNNKLFDSSEKGPGFKFKLGKGEVIKGWDLGVEGMKVGGKRRLTIPANLAYGKKGAPPDIPPNSTLVFDVELKNVS